MDDTGSADSGSNVKLALAILFLWLSGVCFFVAFQGAKFLPQSAGPGGWFPAIVREGIRRAQTLESP